MVAGWIILAGSAALPAGLTAQDIDLTGDRLPDWELTEELRIGSLDGEHDAFHGVGGARIGPDGEAFILDRGIPAVRVFDGEGRFLRQIGGRGQGPGELLSPLSWDLVSDTLWIADQRLGRVSLFTLGGELVRDHRISEARGSAGGLSPVQALPGGGFLAVAPLGPDLRRAERGVVAFQQHLLRLGPEMAVQDTLNSYGVEFPALHAGAGGIVNFNAAADGPLAVHSADPEIRTLIIHRRVPEGRETEAEFRIRVTGSEEDREITVRYAPVPLPGAVRDSVRSSLQGTLDRSGAPRSTTAELMELATLPETLPPVTAATLAPDGSLWLERERFTERTRWLVLDRELAPVAHVVAPAGRTLRLTAVSGDHVWAVEEDELGVESVVRYRIVRP